MDENFIRERITELRLKQNISEYKMSLDLGHSKSYIQSISSGKSLPSLTEFLAICDYLKITPKNFFDDECDNPAVITTIVNDAKTLNAEQLNRVATVVQWFKESSK